MQILETLITIIHIFVSVVLVLVVLLQSGKGGGMGAAFGGAGSQIFGGRGAGTFLAKITTGAAVVFMLTALSLSFLSSQQRSVVAGAASSPVETEETGDAGTGEADTLDEESAVEPSEAGAEGAAATDASTAPAAEPAAAPEGEPAANDAKPGEAPETP